MQPVSYTVSTHLSDDLAAIDVLRTKILTLPIAPRVEHALQWRGFVETILGSLTLSRQLISRQEIEHTLSRPRPVKTQTGMTIGAYANALRWIYQHWSGNPTVISAGDIAVLSTVALSQPHHTQTAFSQAESDIVSFCRYMSSQHDHPVVSAALSHAYFLHSGVGAGDLGKIARLTSTMLLAQSGYDLRGLSHPESVWAGDPKAYEFSLNQAEQLGQLTPWLEYVAGTLKVSFTQLLTQVERECRGIEAGDEETYSTLSHRQQHILEMGAPPGSRITNRQVQSHVHILAITASRDLTKLTALGLLYAHGKGRSVYYTRV